MAVDMDNLASIALSLRWNPDQPDLIERQRELRLQRSQELGLIVSPEDEDVLSSYTWTASGKGSPNALIGTHKKGLNVLIHSRMTGRSLDSYARNEAVRHVCNSNPNDCRRENIHLIASHKLNNRELNKRLHGSNQSGVRNVGWSKVAKKWMVRFSLSKKQYYFGTYDSLDHATALRDVLDGVRFHHSMLPDEQVLAKMREAMEVFNNGVST
jgi:hypothetical protein